jgi:hypothetical protein
VKQAVLCGLCRPKWVADFLEVVESEDREIVMRRAYEKVNELLDALRIKSWEK